MRATLRSRTCILLRQTVQINDADLPRLAPPSSKPPTGGNATKSHKGEYRRASPLTHSDLNLSYLRVWPVDEGPDLLRTRGNDDTLAQQKGYVA